MFAAKLNNEGHNKDDLHIKLGIVAIRGEIALASTKALYIENRAYGNHDKRKPALKDEKI